LISGAFAQPSCPQHDPKSNDGLVAVEHRWVEALDHRNQKALACILATEFKDSGVYGQVRDRSNALAELPNRRPAMQQLRDLELLLNGDTGIVRGVNRLTKPDGSPLADVRFTDVFIFRKDRWQAISAQETLVRPANQK
jgi:hypothetical protein